MVWDIDTGAIIAILDGFKGPALATSDGRRIVSLERRLLKWWDVRHRRELLYLAVPDEIRLGHLALSTNGHELAAASAEKLIVWEDAPPR